MPGNLNVQRDQAEGLLRRHQQGGLGACGAQDGKALGFEQQTDEIRRPVVVLDHQRNAFLEFGCAPSQPRMLCGRSRRISSRLTQRQPGGEAGALALGAATATVPPCSSASCLTIARPRPVPSNLRARLLSI
jgi:hypothetical protein